VRSALRSTKFERGRATFNLAWQRRMAATGNRVEFSGIYLRREIQSGANPQIPA